MADMTRAVPGTAGGRSREGGSGLRGFVVSTVLVAATLAFSLGINLGAFRQNHAGTLMAAFAVVGDKAAANIQDALGYGKPLDDFYGLSPILDGIARSLPWVRDVQVALVDGRVVHTAAGPSDTRMRDAARRRAAAELAKRPYWFDHDAGANLYSLYVPIRTGDRVLAGFLIIVTDGGAIDSRVAEVRDDIVGHLAWAGGGTVAIFGLFAVLRGLNGRLRSRWERGQRLLTLGLLVAVQIAAGVESHSQLSQAHLETAERATELVARMVRDDIETVIRRGVGYGSLDGIDRYFDRIRTAMPTLAAIALLPDGAIPEQPMAQRRGGWSLAPPQDLTLRWTLAADRWGAAPNLVVTVSGGEAAKPLTEFALDAATILITSLLFMFELHRALGSRRSAAASPKGGPGAETVGVSIRFATFLMYFGAFLPVSFVPLMMNGFDRDLFGLPAAKAAAAPLTAEMVAGVAAALLAGRLAPRAGGRALTLAGFAAGGAGMALAAGTGDPLVFVLARALSGAGTMCGLIGINSLIGRLRGRMDTPAVQAGMFAGMYAGVNCGAVSGALLAASNGPFMVFAAGAVLPLVGLIHTLLAFPNLEHQPALRPAAAPGGSGAFGRQAVVGFLLLISIPTAAAAMFQPFYLPLFVSDLGLSTATVGRAYLLHGLCVVMVGPLLTRWAVKRVPVAAVTLLSGCLIAAALALFGLRSSLWTAFATVFLIGVAESVGLAAQIRHVETLSGDARRRDAALALHVNARKAGQAVGPMLFSTLAAAGPGGVGVIGAGLAGSLILFAVLLRQWRGEPSYGPEGSSS